MGKALVEWSEQQRAQLQSACKHHAKPYVREKCAALLKVAIGRSCQEVARTGLLNRHAPDTLSDWIASYQQEGLDGLLVHKGRGRKPAFSPSRPDTGAGQGATYRGGASGSALVRPAA
jgi:hypothetical protein